MWMAHLIAFMEIKLFYSLRKHVEYITEAYLRYSPPILLSPFFLSTPLLFKPTAENNQVKAVNLWGSFVELN